MITQNETDRLISRLEGLLKTVEPGETLSTENYAVLLVYQLLDSGSSWVVVGNDLAVHTEWHQAHHLQVRYGNPGLEDAICVTYVHTPGGPSMRDEIVWQKRDGSPDLDTLLTRIETFLELRHAVIGEDTVS